MCLYVFRSSDTLPIANFFDKCLLTSVNAVVLKTFIHTM